MSSTLKSLLLCLAATASASSHAVVNRQVTDGKLTGATGIQVGASFYDVAFRVGSCNSFVAGCGGGSFVIQSFNVTAAAEALRDQVFTGAFDTDLSSTFGCAANTTYCQVVTPYAIRSVNPNFFNYVAFGNAAVDAEDFVTNTSPSLLRAADMSFYNNSRSSVVLAVWSPSQQNPDPIDPPPLSPIPEPGTYALMLAGLGLVVAAARRRQTSAV